MTLWGKKVNVKGPAGTKALRQVLPCCSRKNQQCEELEAGGSGGE